MATAASVVRPDHNSLGKAGFIVGIIGLVLAFIPIIGFVAWLLAPLAILFGLIALRKAPRSLAIAGIVTGILALVICFSWIKGVEQVGKAVNRDTFNNSGDVVDLSTAPVMEASIKQVWTDIEANKVAAGQKYGGHRLHFTKERIAEFGGDAASPTVSFVGKSDEFINNLVTASFGQTDGKAIAGLKKGGRVSFTCNKIGETFTGGYSLDECRLD